MPSTHIIPYWLAATHLPISPRKLKSCIETFATIEHFFQASAEELRTLAISEKGITAIQQIDWQKIDKDMAWLTSSSLHHLITLEDVAYPCLLKEISDPPLALYVYGNKEALSHTQIAVVGARNASPMGLSNAEHFAKCLAQAGFAITSGLARGIDAHSHRGALAAKGITIGVCGTGLRHIYPVTNQHLVEEIIAADGAVISEFPLSTLPHPHHFPRRNRIIAGLSTGVLVVEAALKSGSLITARHALEQGREVFAIPGSIHHALARGCHHLIRQGAKLVETAQDILEELSALCAAAKPVPGPQISPKTADLAPKPQQILALIENEITPLDMILLRSGLTASEVSSILLSLELKGYIQSVTGGYIRLGANR